jgi:hypothetical protein
LWQILKRGDKPLGVEEAKAILVLHPDFVEDPEIKNAFLRLCKHTVILMVFKIFIAAAAAVVCCSYVSSYFI